MPRRPFSPGPTCALFTNWSPVKIRQIRSSEVIAMAQEDARVRDHLASTGELFGGYHPKMEKVHQKNAARLQHIVNEYGWPGQSLLGEDGYRGGLVNSPAGYRR